MGKTGARHLKKSRRVLCQGVAAQYAVIQQQLRSEHSVPRLCRTLEVSPSGFYAWLRQPESPRRKEEARLEIEIKAAHRRNRETYGPERLQADFAEHGIYVGVHKIKRLRQKLGLRCKQTKKFKVTTNSNHSLPVAGNLLGQNFSEYIEIFYNRQRLQKRLGYLSPAAYEKKYFKERCAA